MILKWFVGVTDIIKTCTYGKMVIYHCINRKLDINELDQLHFVSGKIFLIAYFPDYDSEQAILTQVTVS